MGYGFLFKLLLSILVSIIFSLSIHPNLYSPSPLLLGRGAGGEAPYSLFITSAGFTCDARRICHSTVSRAMAATIIPATRKIHSESGA